MRTSALFAALLFAPPALAKDVHELAWDISLDGRKVGTRKATVTIDRDVTPESRMVQAFTQVDAKVGSLPLKWQQRLTVLGSEEPAAFHAVLSENGAPREVQARWTGSSWLVTLADRSGTRTYEAAPQRIDLTTADLLDPGSSYRLAAFDSAKVLSAETGDIWEGAVESLGPARLQVGGKDVDVQGWSWTTPEGRSEFWYDADGWLVRYEMRVLGHKVAGMLTTPPPQGPDTFQVEPTPGAIQTTDL